MENEILKINILAIAISGLLMLVAGVCLYYFKEQLTGGSMRFFLPIPPIGVAAYIFVFNMFKHYQCSIAETSTMISEMFIATIASAFFFFIFTVILIFLISFLKDI
ncbi:MAG: hypothetical protein KAQ72_17225 [Desulfobacula sp.]|nr:hypothetical protein [Desulfobacula sp.]